MRCRVGENACLAITRMGQHTIQQVLNVGDWHLQSLALWPTVCVHLGRAFSHDPSRRRLTGSGGLSALQMVAWTHLLALPILLLLGLVANWHEPFRRAACGGCASVTTSLAAAGVGSEIWRAVDPDDCRTWDAMRGNLEGGPEERKRDGNSKDEKKEPKGEERSWTGVSSVWEFQAAMISGSLEGEKDSVSRELPPYLDEATLCLRGGPGDTKRKLEAAATSPCSILASDLETRVELLRRVVQRDSCVMSATSLFWLVLSGIFQCVPDQVTTASRTALGRSWHTLQLEVGPLLNHDQRARQWVTSCLPFLFAQAVFRMVFDGFPEDRNSILNHSDNFMNQIVLVIQFEMLGFQINLDTAKKLRRSLFLQRVLQHPHVNQVDYLRGQQRQAELESQNLHTRPLKFGHLDAPRPDEIQLEHVLQGRADEKSGKMNWMAAASGTPKREKELVPPDLSRYLQLSTQGMAMLDNHISGMARIGNEEEEVEEFENPAAELDIDLIESSVVERRMAHMLGAATSGPSLSRGASSMNLLLDEDFGDESPTSPMSPMSPTSPVSPVSASSRVRGEDSEMVGMFSEGKKAVRVRRARMAGHLTTMQKKANEKREEEAKLKRQRQERLEQKLKTELLPEAMRSTQLSTTWVSPGMKSLYTDAHDRDVMRMSRSSAFSLKMAPANPQMMGSKRRGSSKEPGATSTSGLGDRPERAASRTLARGGETLTLEPAWNLSSKVVYNRLDVALKASQEHSFAMYTKEYDVFTGDLKQRFDEKRLRDEEDDAYLKRMRSMVGGKTKKLLYPGGELGRRSRSSGAL
ncbi:unnamed protein product [Effrenium voratum]|nr:unnamed protein product [Effrenium voratum]